MTKKICFKCKNIVEEINNYNKINGIKYYFHTNCITEKYITKEPNKEINNKKYVKQIYCYL
jgi:hypothetical protein